LDVPSWGLVATSGTRGQLFAVLFPVGVWVGLLVVMGGVVFVVLIALAVGVGGCLWWGRGEVHAVDVLGCSVAAGCCHPVGLGQGSGQDTLCGNGFVAPYRRIILRFFIFDEESEIILQAAEFGGGIANRVG